MAEENTIVTAFDHNYIWGGFLLVASLRMHNVRDRIHIAAEGLSPEDEALFLQFEDVVVAHIKRSCSRNMTTEKPQALLAAKTEFVTWLDADCIAVGNLSPFLVAPNKSFQIRQRSAEETDPKHKCIPPRVLDIWKEDVGERESPAMDKTYVANAFVLHRSHLPFIERWQAQLHKVIPPESSGVVNPNSVAYRMTDEAVLNSLFAFAHDSPPVSEFVLDKDPNAWLAHFGQFPKPWEMWLRGNWKHYEHIQDLLAWSKASGFKTPPLPFSFRRKWKLICLFITYIYALRVFARGAIRRLLDRFTA